MRKVAIFVDHENLTIAARNRGFNIDWADFKHYLADDELGRELIEAFCYVAIDPRAEHAKDREINALREAGWFVKTKVGAPAGEGHYKCNVDVEMAIDMCFFSADVKPNIVVAVTGDQDFAPAVLRLRERGIRVEIAAFPENLSHVLIKSASGCINLERYADEYNARQTEPDAPMNSAELPPATELENDRGAVDRAPYYDDEDDEEDANEKNAENRGDYDDEEDAGIDDGENGDNGENDDTHPRPRRRIPFCGRYF